MSDATEKLIAEGLKRSPQDNEHDRPLSYTTDGTLIHRLATALTAAESARIKAEQERDAGDAALLFLMGTGALCATTDGWLEANGISEAIAAARARAKLKES